MHKNQQVINNASIDWCFLMPFSGKEKDNLGTANWLSDNYLSFTRMSLFHLGPLDGKIEIPENNFEGLYKGYENSEILRDNN